MNAPSLAYDCIECGRAGDAQFYVGAADLRARRVCFTCGFWQDRAAEAHLPTSVRVGGVHYQIGPKGDPYPGHGGARFVVHFADGRAVETNNLWHQGEIPARFRARLPDNATFVREHTTRREEAAAQG